MNGTFDDKTKRIGGIDPAALAAATLSAAITVFAPPGPYSPGGMLVGITVLAVILGFDHEPSRDQGESFAYSAVFALVAWLAIAYPIEVVCAGIYGIGDLQGWAAAKARLQVILNENAFQDIYHREDLRYSQIPPIVIMVIWALLCGGRFIYDRRISRKNILQQPRKQNPPPENAA